MLKNQKTRLIIYGILGLIVMGKTAISPDKTAEELYPIYAAALPNSWKLTGETFTIAMKGKARSSLIHGTGGSCTWQAWAEELRKTSYYSQDLPAYGLTGADPDTMVKRLCRFNRCFSDAVEVEKFHIGGNSLGGLVAWLYTSYTMIKSINCFCSTLAVSLLIVLLWSSNWPKPLS